MNCKEAHLIIAGLTGHELPEKLAVHVRDCPACADLLAMDVELRATLQSRAPEASPYVLGRIRQEIASPVAHSWFERPTRKMLMKITLPALTALAVASALVCLPRSAHAGTAVATFRSMKKAVLAHAKQATQMELHVGKVADGSIGSWIVLDGELIQLGPNGTFHTLKAGKDITVETSTGTGGNPSALTPEQKVKVQQAIRDALNGEAQGGSDVSVHYIVNGKQVDSATAHNLLQQNGLSFSLDIDLNESDYNSIAYGADQDHLVLRSKKAANTRTIVTLDHRSNLPKSVLLEQNLHGKWVAVKQAAVTFERRDLPLYVAPSVADR